MMSSQQAVAAIGSAQASAQSFESMAHRFHQTSSQRRPPVQRTPMHPFKLLEVRASPTAPHKLPPTSRARLERVMLPWTNFSHFANLTLHFFALVFVVISVLKIVLLACGFQ